MANYGTLSDNGNTDTITVNTVPNHAGSDQIHVHCSGTFGSGTFKIQFLGLDGSWHDYSEGSTTTAKDFHVVLRPGTQIRGNLAGATTPSVYWQIN